MEASGSPIQQAELILKLYELRRETVMREARSYAEFRRKMNLPEWMSNLERLIEGSPEGRARIATMQKNLAAIADARSAQTERK